MEFVIHNINPVILPIFGPIAIRWYGFAYLIGFLITFLLLNNWSKKGIFDIPTDKISNFIFLFAIFGVFLGGRLGYQLLYNFDVFIENPLILFKVWEGGMSSHGGFIGTIIFMLLYAKKEGYSFWNISDHIALTASLGIACGRIANFINGELWGRVTDVKWAIIFPQEIGLKYGDYDTKLINQLYMSGVLSPRHPSQIYQAICEGFIVFLVLLYFRKTKLAHTPGILSSYYLILYAITRILVEFFREPDSVVYFGWMTKGQLYSLLMLFSGFLIYWRRKKVAS